MFPSLYENLFVYKIEASEHVFLLVTLSHKEEKILWTQLLGCMKFDHKASAICFCVVVLFLVAEIDIAIFNGLRTVNFQMRWWLDYITK